MSIRVLLREHPHRSIALQTTSHVLIFRHSASSTDSINGALNPDTRTSLDIGSTPKCMVEFADVASTDLSDYRNLSPQPVHGTLGLITIDNDVFLCVLTGASKVASVRPGETVDRIHGVEFYCLNKSDYDNTSQDPYSLEEDSYGQNITRRDPLLEAPYEELKKLLSNGSFYFSTDFDITNRLQDRPTEATMLEMNQMDESFLWNSYMISPLANFRARLEKTTRDALDSSRMLTSAIRGFVLTITIPPSSAPLRAKKIGLPSSLTLISRLSCRRAGTRFNSRGIDDDGNVANFVESETIYWSPTNPGNSVGDTSVNEKPAGLCFSYAQIRGSVPVFWEQAAGLLPGQQKITVTRSAEGAQPAFDKHFSELEQNYGAVHIVNLLSETKPGEAELTNQYKNGVRHCVLNVPREKGSRDHQLLRETEFDFHAETKGPNGYEAASMIRRLIENSADGFAYYLSEEVEDVPEDRNEKPHRRTVVVLQQEGVFRTNCLDCLDRTNLIQTIISQMAVESFLGHRGERAASDFWMRHSSLWADNGDALSRIYAGTGALKSSFTRSGKMSLAGAIADARKSATRLYINNFADKGRQNTIDVLLGRLVGQTPVHLFDPINDYVTAELTKRSSEFQHSEVINIFAGTFNLNGRTTGIDQDLSDWLCPQIDASQQQPEIVAVGFQEIVELSAQNIMNSDPTRKQAWEKAVRKTLNRHARAAGSEHYVLLRSGQLVGAALCIFVKSSVLQHIKNVEGSMKKTGMSGMAGNKGAVAIRMEYANTQICFVTAHLAAGFANYEERNRDYTTIHHGLRFQRNRGIDNHDTVIWMGDFNYRIGLGSEKVRQLIKVGDLESLYENDQLNLQMVAGLTFPYYSEARITFNPTYKFDLGNDTYDTSEKARIPAWTDRILRKGGNLRQVHYNSAPLRFSDHRPVFATFLCTVSIIDEVIREELSHQIYEKRRRDVGSSTANTPLDDTDDEDLIGYDPIEPGLPPASSDKKKWWLENGQFARSNLEPPQKGAIPNPKRPSNPYTITDEPEWVTVPRMTQRDSSKSVTAPPPPPSRSATNGTRKLPPPFNASTISSLSQVPSQTSLNGQAFTNRSSTPITQASHINSDRRLSTSTTSSSSKRAPPVAKKPIHLTSSASPILTASPTQSTNSITIAASQARRPITTSTNSSTAVDHTGFAPPPRRATDNIISSNYGGGGGSRRGDIEGGRSLQSQTPLPPTPPQSRRTTTTTTTTKGVKSNGGDGDREGPRPGLPPRPTRDLLADDDDDGGYYNNNDSAGGGRVMKGWEVLKPN